MRRLPLFIAIGLLIAGSLNLISNADPPAARQVFRGMLAHANDIEALTVGSSISTAVDFGALGMRGWHMWTPGSDLLENEYILRAALPKLPNLRVVLIAVPPVAFQWLNTARGAPEVRRQQYLAAGPSLADGAIDGDWSDLAIAWALPLVRDDQWRDLIAAGLARVGLPVERPTALMTQDGRWLPRTRAADLGARRLATPGAAATTFASVEATLAADPKAPARLAAAAPRIARLLSARGIAAVFYTPPVAPEYEAIFDHRTVGQISDARADMRRIAAANGLTYIDLSRDPEMIRAVNGLFYDPVHLTVAGASVFTARLEQELQAHHTLNQMTAPARQAPPR